MRCDLVAGAVRRIKERDNCVAHALVRHKAPARVGLLGLCAGAFPFRLRFVKALLELLCVEVGAGVVAGVPELRPRIARPGGDRRIEVVAAVARNEPRLALVGAAVAVRCRVQQVGNVHLRLVEPRVVDIEVVQVILFLSAVVASVVPQPVVAGIGADDLIAGLLAARVVQDGEIVRPALSEVTIIRHILPAHGFDFHARLVRGLHLVLEVPQLQHRAVGGEVAERIALLQPRHAHIGDRVFNRTGRIVVVFRHGVGHRAFFEVFHARGGIVVHRGVDRVVLLFQPVDPANTVAILGKGVAAVEVIADAQIQRAILLLKQKDKIWRGLGVMIVEIIRQLHAPRSLVVAAQCVQVGQQRTVKVFLRQRDGFHRREGGLSAVIDHRDGVDTILTGKAEVGAAFIGDIVEGTEILPDRKLPVCHYEHGIVACAVKGGIIFLAALAPADGAARRERQRQHEGDNAEPALFLRAEDVRDAPLEALDRPAEARRRGQRPHAGLHGGEQCPAVSRALGELEPVGRGAVTGKLNVLVRLTQHQIHHGVEPVHRVGREQHEL